jgi:hypothetical protein
MRIWHEELVPKLCQKHLCAVWREALGCYNIVTSDKKGYRNHPATKEFLGRPHRLWYRLKLIRAEMLSRGYHPKDMPSLFVCAEESEYEPWQSLEEQIGVLRAKGCKCDV